VISIKRDISEFTSITTILAYSSEALGDAPH